MTSRTRYYNETIYEHLGGDRLLLKGLILLAGAWMILAVVFPVGQMMANSLMSPSGEYIGPANFKHYFTRQELFGSLKNSLFVSLTTTVCATIPGFMYAYALTRTNIRFKQLFLALAMVPLFAPTLLNGITLVYLFGKKGIVTTGGFGLLNDLFGIRRIDIPLYGPLGIIISEVLYTFPQAVLILSIALGMSDARLYEAAESLGASNFKKFRTVTLPSVKYGLFNALVVCFVLSFTDFGAPKVIGGNYNVLATDIYKQVIGQQNFNMGATVSVILLLPSLLAFIADRWIQKRQASLISAESVPLVPPENRCRDRFFFGFCMIPATIVLVFLATAVFASLVKVWPYDFSLGMKHYRFEYIGGGGYAALWGSIQMAFWTALAGTAIVFISAYVVEKGSEMTAVRQWVYRMSLLPMALPGLVLGLSYIFFFNTPSWPLGQTGISIPNPLHCLYGTMGILVICNMVHFYSVAFLTATTALKQLDAEFENVSESLGIPFYKTFYRITLPVCLPAFLETMLYFFVNSMATVSAVIFLYSPDLPIASVAVANMDDAGDIAPAAAMSVLIVLINIGVRIIFTLLTRGIRNHSKTWRNT